MNAQALIPPSASNIDSWEAIGNKYWNYATLAPYLRKPFSIRLPEEEVASHLQLSWAKELASESDGPIKASFTDVKENPLGKAWLKTFENLGYPLTASPFSGKSIGAYSNVSTTNPMTKTRSCANTAYYLPIANRPNLTLILNATVQKIILLDGEDSSEKTATGVEYVQDNTVKTISSHKEIILSAGVFNSPKILELSGIGDPDLLRKHSVDVKIANPFVGTNLQDHAVAGISFEAADGVFTGDDMMRKDPAVLKWAMDLYQTHQAGPFASSGLVSFGYLPTVDFSKDTQALTHFITSISESKSAHPLDKARLSILRSLIEQGDEGTGQFLIFPAQSNAAGNDTTTGLDNDLQPGNFITLAAALSHPISTGTVHISSKDTSIPPTIDHRYLSNDLDVEILARHIRYVETIAKTGPLCSLLKVNGRRAHPASLLDNNLEKAKEYARIGAASNWHSCGTCAMAPRESGGVVDEKLRVYGVRNLRIVDASIFPLVPQCNLQSLVYAVAERASDIIKGDN
jgi:choline dehydrogenase-like flavoprotein